jgi:hypothetical protein
MALFCQLSPPNKANRCPDEQQKPQLAKGRDPAAPDELKICDPELDSVSEACQFATVALRWPTFAKAPETGCCLTLFVDLHPHLAAFISFAIERLGKGGRPTIRSESENFDLEISGWGLHL